MSLVCTLCDICENADLYRGPPSPQKKKKKKKKKKKVLMNCHNLCMTNTSG